MARLRDMLCVGRTGPTGDVLSPQLSADGLEAASVRQTVPLTTAERLSRLAWRAAEVRKSPGPATTRFRAS